MAYIRIQVERNFTTIPNELINDPNLDWRDVGLLTYLLSKPDNWVVNSDHLTTLKKSKRDAIRASIKSIIEAGYMKRSPIRGSDGKMSGWSYVVANTPVFTGTEPETDKPTTDKPTTDKPTTEKTATVEITEPSKDAGFTESGLTDYGQTDYGQTDYGKGGFLIRTDLNKTKALKESITREAENSDVVPAEPEVKKFDWRKIELPYFVDAALWESWNLQRKKNGGGVSELSITRLLATLCKIESDPVLRKNGITANEAMAIAEESGWKGMNPDWLHNRTASSANAAPAGKKPPVNIFAEKRKEQEREQAAIDSTATVINNTIRTIGVDYE